MLRLLRPTTTTLLWWLLVLIIFREKVSPSEEVVDLVDDQLNDQRHPECNENASRSSCHLCCCCFLFLILFSVSYFLFFFVLFPILYFFFHGIPIFFFFFFSEKLFFLFSGNSLAYCFLFYCGGVSVTLFLPLTSQKLSGPNKREKTQCHFFPPLHLKLFTHVPAFFKNYL